MSAGKVSDLGSAPSITERCKILFFSLNVKGWGATGLWITLLACTKPWGQPVPSTQ